MKPLLAGMLAATAPSLAPAQMWLSESFDARSPGALRSQGWWAGNTDRICVVTTTSVAGKAVCCDGDESPMLPVVYEVHRPVDAPESGMHLFSFAVRVEARTDGGGRQAAIILRGGQTDAIELAVLPTTVEMFIRNDYLFLSCKASWDIGDVPGGNPDITTGTFHVFELELDFGRPGDVMDDFVRDVRLDGKSQAGLFSASLPGPICLETPIDRLVLVNGATTAVSGGRDDAVFFDDIIGRGATLRARHWELY